MKIDSKRYDIPKNIWETLMSFNVEVKEEIKKYKDKEVTEDGLHSNNPNRWQKY